MCIRDRCRHYKNEAEAMLEENWRVRLEELSFESHDRRGITRTGSRVSLYRVSSKSAFRIFLTRKQANSHHVFRSYVNCSYIYPRRRQSWGYGFTGVCVCLSLCLIFRTISQKPMQLGSPNLPQKCSRWVLETFYFGGQRVKGQGPES